jgi:preprotein translocase subunit SecE
MRMFRKKEEGEDGRSRPAPPPSSMPGMSREMKRMMKRGERSRDRLVRPPAAARKRTRPRQFLKEVRGELGRVAWPSRREVLTYTVVVLVSVAFFMTIIGGLDYLFTKGLLEVLPTGGR